MQNFDNNKIYHTEQYKFLHQMTRNASGIVLCSPTYNWNCYSELKNILSMWDQRLLIAVSLAPCSIKSSLSSILLAYLTATWRTLLCQFLCLSILNASLTPITCTCMIVIG
ncbi:hypothetical protein [Veronia nyctiphanis]|uniref:hypothetical protein n=1 Tax=Veronia nyctiphanis TaxID=1278244 RepID=UPI002E269B1D